MPNIDVLLNTLGEYVNVLYFQTDGLDRNRSKFKNRELIIDYTKSIFKYITQQNNQKLVIINNGFDLNFQIELKQNISLQIVLVEFGSQQNKFNFELSGEDSKLRIDGICIGSKSENIHNEISIHHIYSKSSGEFLFKNLARDKSAINQSIEILIDKNLNRVTSDLKIKSLQLSPESRITAKPNLRILSKDVKCAHASTISNIDERELFYLMSRGIPLKEATEILVEAFSNDIYDQILA